MASVRVWVVVSCGRLSLILVPLICVITNCFYHGAECIVLLVNYYISL